MTKIVAGISHVVVRNDIAYRRLLKRDATRDVFEERVVFEHILAG